MVVVDRVSVSLETMVPPRTRIQRRNGLCCTNNWCSWSLAEDWQFAGVGH